MVFQDDLLRDVFEGDPLGRRGIFESLIPQDVMGQQRQALSQMFEPTFNRYLGQLTQDPSTKFTDFAMGDFDPRRQLARLPGSVGGFNSQRTLFNL